jgi:hypothetical protein
MACPSSKLVAVSVPNNMTLEQAQHVLANVLGKAGHPHCYSGINFAFVNAVDPSPMTLHVDANFNVHAQQH